MPDPAQPLDRLVGHLFRHESGRMAAVLTRMLGTSRLDEVEDIVQDTLLKALEVWKYKGVPHHPTAWLFTVAKRKAIDCLRAGQARKRLHGENPELASEWTGTEEHIQDSVLRFMFACCHPSIAPESQVAFTLRTLGGLSTQEIASAFMTSEETISKRIYRAKEKLRLEKTSMEPPPLDELPKRLEQVLNVLYLLFNEGYYSSNPAMFVREDLCAEAMRLAFLLIQQPQTNLPEARALLALMCLQASRFPARANDQNQIVLLEQQDRLKWNKDLIQRGLGWLESAATGNWLTPYHVEAAIASVHAVAPTFDQTNWLALHQLYDTLYAMKPTPATALNRAIAIGYAQSATEGISALSVIESLEGNQYYHTALGVFFAKESLHDDARIQFNRALTCTASLQERELIAVHLSKLPGG